MVRGTRLARSATRARAHRASRHRLRLTLRPSLIHAPQDCINARRRRGERHGRRAGALAAQRHRLERSRRPAPPCTVPGRTAVAANDSGSAALPACAGVAAGAIWSARTMTPPPATPAPTRPAPTRPAPTPDSRCCRGRTSAVASEAVGPHRPTRSCEAPDARRALGGGCEGLPELSECHGRACRAVLSGFDTLELQRRFNASLA